MISKPFSVRGRTSKGERNTLSTNGLCQFLQGSFLEGAARVGLGLIQESKRDIAIFRGIDDLGFP